MNTGASRMALGCIVLGIAGALSAFGGQPAAASSSVQAPSVSKSSTVCAAVASYAGERNSATIELRHALGCKTDASLQ